MIRPEGNRAIAPFPRPSIVICSIPQLLIPPPPTPLADPLKKPYFLLSNGYCIDCSGLLLGQVDRSRCLPREVEVMKVMQWFRNATQYLMEAASRLFSPTDDFYPATGMQPFDGDPYDGSAWDD